MKYRILFLSILSALLTISCSSSPDEGGEEEEDIPADYLAVSMENVEFEYIGSEEIVNVTSGSAWIAYPYIQDPTIDQLPDWISIKPDKGTGSRMTEMMIKVTENLSPGPRKCKIAVEIEQYGVVKYITVTQNGKPSLEKTAYLSPDKIISSTYPDDVKGSKTTVQSDIYGLWFYGWNVEDDRRFNLTFPSDNSNIGRVIMTYRMGCGPMGGSGYDHNTNIAVKYDNQWYEIASCITPFGNAFDGSFEKKYYFDVTEYLPMLKGDVEFKIYFGGFDASESGRHHTAQLTFDMYECQGKGDMVFAQRVYDSEETGNTGYRSWLYGRTGVSIEEENRLSKRTITVPEGVKSLQMKVTITGHGADQGKFLDRPGYQTRNAAEFDYNWYTVNINGVPCQQKGYIFVSCADNYSQAGTCYYDRGNWCPGNPAHVDIWKFVNVKGGDTFDLDIDLERFQSIYTQSADGQAMYRVHVDIFGFNK